MGEWLIPAVLKTVVPEKVPGVRIPLPPPLHGIDARTGLVANREGERFAQDYVYLHKVYVINFLR